VAVVFLYAPLAGAAWTARGMACCTAGHCSIPEHRHSKAPAAPDSAMDCVHEMAGMASCSMSCCQSPDRPAVTPIAFLLPSLDSLSPIVEVIESPGVLKSIEIPRSIEPVSPPPRFVAAAV
jgi:hypothetical protein